MAQNTNSLYPPDSRASIPNSSRQMAALLWINSYKVGLRAVVEIINPYYCIIRRGAVLIEWEGELINNTSRD